jgi:hypothetical protein
MHMPKGSLFRIQAIPAAKIPRPGLHTDTNNIADMLFLRDPFFVNRRKDNRENHCSSPDAARHRHRAGLLSRHPRQRRSGSTCRKRLPVAA